MALGWPCSTCPYAIRQAVLPLSNELPTGHRLSGAWTGFACSFSPVTPSLRLTPLHVLLRRLTYCILHPEQGIAVDVSRPGQARVLADTAAAELGRVDIWWVQAALARVASL